MNDVKFSCPGCAQHIECDDAYSGDEINCPLCQQPIVVPPPEDSLFMSEEVVAGDIGDTGNPALDVAGSKNTTDSRRPARFFWMIAGGIIGLALGGVSALLFADFLAHRPAASPGAHGLRTVSVVNSPSSDASEILGKVAEFYHGLNTFTAVDHQETVVDTAKVDTGKLAAIGGMSRLARPGQPITIDCDLELAKPGFYRITWVQSLGTNVLLRGGAWSSGQGDFVYRWPTNSYFKATSKASALAAVPGFMGMVVNAFFGLPGNRLLDIDRPARIKDETLDSRDCYVVSGTLDGDRVIVWVAKTDFRIVQLKMIANAAPVSIGEEEIIHSLKNAGKKVTPEAIATMKDAVMAMSAVRGSFTESYQHCQANQSTGERAFIFDLPEGATFLTGQP